MSRVGWVRILRRERGLISRRKCGGELVISIITLRIHRHASCLAGPGEAVLMCDHNLLPYK
jgi:hypothetical protein